MLSYLRVMDEADLDWVMAVEKHCQRQPWSRDGFVRALHQGFNFVFCDDDDRRLGYCCLLPVVDELHLLNITLAADYQAQGIGKQAMQALFSRFENTQYTVMLLEVRKSNKAARALYQAVGFEQDGVRKNYYQVEDGGREDAILLSKRLDS